MTGKKKAALKGAANGNSMDSSKRQAFAGFDEIIIS